MNSYAIIILTALLLEFSLSLISDILNLRHLKNELPDEFKDVYDEKKYRLSQAYLKVNTYFGFISSGFMFGITLLFWFAKGFNFLDTQIRSLGLHPIWNGLIFVGTLIFLRTLLSLPFDIFSTFVIEEKFGFNKTTAKTFIFDLLKGIGLSILIGAPLFAGILAFFQYAGPLAWLWSWAAVTLFSLFIQFIAPVLILPLFNKFTPLEQGELKDKIIAFADKVKFPLSNIFVMDGSRRTAKSNAFFTGFGKHRRIALYDTLIQNHTTDQLVAVLAHEIGHYKKKHILKGTIISIVHSGILFFLISIFLHSRGLFNAFYMEHTSVYAGLLFFGLLYTPVELVLSIVMNYVSRKHEFEADRFAAENTGRAQDLVSALKKLSADNLSNLNPHPFTVFMNYSHPPVLERIIALNKFNGK